MLLPDGYAALELDFGETISEARHERRWKQEALAQAVGISRETLSRIESKHRPPRMRVLLHLLHELELDLSDVAISGPAANKLRFNEGHRGDMLDQIGRDLAARRLMDGRRTLKELGAKVGISPATLSRLERGQVPRSRLLREATGHEAFDFDDRTVEVANEQLDRYISGVDFHSL